MILLSGGLPIDRDCPAGIIDLLHHQRRVELVRIDREYDLVELGEGQCSSPGR